MVESVLLILQHTQNYGKVSGLFNEFTSDFLLISLDFISMWHDFCISDFTIDFQQRRTRSDPLTPLIVVRTSKGCDLALTLSRQVFTMHFVTKVMPTNCTTSNRHINKGLDITPYHANSYLWPWGRTHTHAYCANKSNVKKPRKSIISKHNFSNNFF